MLKLYKTFIEETLFLQIGVYKSISEKTARIWLWKLGLVPQSWWKGIYLDGYERPDVVEYQNKFLEKMECFERLIPIFEGDNMDQKNPTLSKEEKLHILVTYDESFFYVNDDHPIIWAPLGE